MDVHVYSIGTRKDYKLNFRVPPSLFLSLSLSLSLPLHLSFSLSVSHLSLSLFVSLFSLVHAVVACPDLGIPNNGRRINSNFSLGEVVYFVCQDDYDMIGSSARVCQADTGSWSGTPASCILRNSELN